MQPFGSMLQSAAQPGFAPARRQRHNPFESLLPIRPEMLQEGAPLPGLPSANPAGEFPPAAATAQQAPAEVAPRMSKGQLIAGILADALSGAVGRPGQFAAQVTRQREQAAQAVQEQARWHRDRTAGIEDFETRQQIEQRYRPAPTPYRFEDNAGNVWQMGPTGEPQRIFTDTAPRQIIQDGMAITIPNPYAPAPAAAAPPPTIDESLWDTGQPVGGQTPASGNFRPR